MRSKHPTSRWEEKQIGGDMTSESVGYDCPAGGRPKVEERQKRKE